MLKSFNCYCSLLIRNPHSYPKQFITSLKLFSTDVLPQESHIEKIIKVAIVGVPNAGKSTVINALLDRKVCATSNKVHTTKTKAEAICNVDKTQIVFLDTPGLISPKEKKKYNLPESMRLDISNCLKNSDIIGVIQDVGSPWTREFIHRGLVELLEKFDRRPSFLILNKIDLMKSKRKLLDVVRILCNNKIAGLPISKLSQEGPMNGFGGFSDVFMISALEGDGLNSIKEYLMKNAKPGKWLYPESDWTNQSQETLILEAIRAKFLDFLPQEIPYQLKTELEHLDDNGKVLSCMAVVTCPSERIMKLVSGVNNGRLQQISDSVRYDLMNMFKKSITLTISLRAGSQ
ncbi:GTPase Era, mitochondrial-like [Arctopsyche grandis]|uniref:GTPase Era, mitochondrial-like n=1 Tax=Arctopsyche grandis TaxID=121162 RepID=UPI00406D955A